MSNSEATKLNLIAPSRDPLQELRKAGLYVVMLGGYCPVQCEATLPDGRKLYFLAIGKSWDLVIELTSDEFEGGIGSSFSITSEYWHERFSAGEMPLETVADIILGAIALYQLSSSSRAIA